MDPIAYLNTDLELIASCDLSPLSAAFAARRMRVLFNDLCSNGQWSARFEIERDETSDPEADVADMLSLIESLDPVPFNLCSRCSHREFNIGYNCGDKPWAFNQGLSAQTVARIAGVGASLRITLYPPTPPAS